MWSTLIVGLVSPLIAAQAIVAEPAWDALPTEVSGSARGATAIAVDPAAAGALRGAELQLRHVGAPNLPGFGALGLYGAARLGSLGLAAGYAWQNLPNPRAERGIFSLSWALGPRLVVGAQVHRLQPPKSPITHSVWAAGVLWVPHPVASITLGVDALNAPSWPRRAHMRRTLRAGLAVRPWQGDAWLTLSADARMSWANGAHWPDTRALVDLMPYEGIHALAAFRRHDAGQTIWAGISLDLGGLEVLGAGRAQDAQATQASDRMAWAVTLRSRPPAPLPWRRREHLHIQVDGDLTQAAGLWQQAEAVATLPARLAELADDPDIAQVTLDIGALDVGLATVDELRSSIAALRARGIVVVAHVVGADTRAYWVAAAADRITMDPVGTLDVRGMRISSHFFAEALARVGVRFDAVGVGRFKSAPDRLTQNVPRAEDVQVQQEMLSESYQSLILALTQQRHMSAAAAHAALAQGPMDAPTAQRLGLIDAIEPGPTDSALAPRPAPGTSLSRRANQSPHSAWGPQPRIAVVPLVGTMVQHPADAPWPGAKIAASQVVAALAAAQRDPDVVGAVLRIDSPGGDVVAAEHIYRAVRALARHKPVAVSMGDVAASGGYYAAMGAHRVFAQPQTLTGSIGIFSVKPDLSQLLLRLGVHSHHEDIGERAGWDGLTQPLADADRARLQAHLGSLYGIFIDRVAQGRGLPRQRADDLGQGRVYTGAQAQAAGLVDALGGLADALAWIRMQSQATAQAHATWRVPSRTTRLTELLGQTGAIRSDGPQMQRSDEATNFSWEHNPYAIHPKQMERALTRMSARAWALWPQAALLTPAMDGHND